MPTLEGVIQQAGQDPDFRQLSQADQIQYLDYVLPQADPDYKVLRPTEKTQYLRQVVLPQIQQTIQPPEVQGLGNYPQVPQQNFFSDFGNQFVNEASLNIQDRATGQGVGAALGGAAGAFVPVLAGAGAGALAGSVIPGLGTAAGGIAGGITGALASGAGRAIDRQMDAGVPLENINYGPVTVEAIGEGALQALPFAKGGTLLGRIAKNAALTGGAELPISAALQFAETGGIDPSRLAMDVASAAGGGGAFGGVFGRAPAKPVRTGPRVRAEGAAFGDFGRPAAVRQQGGKVISARQAQAQKFNQLVEYVYQMKKSGQAKEADLILQQYPPQVKARATDAINTRLKAEKEAARTQRQQARRQQIQSDRKEIIDYRSQASEKTIKLRAEAKQAEIKAKAQAQKDILTSKQATEAERLAARQEIARLRNEGINARAEAAKELEEQKYRNREALQAKKPLQGSVSKKEKIPGTAKMKELTADNQIEIPLGRKAEREIINPAKSAENTKFILKQNQLPGLADLKTHPEVKRRPQLVRKLNASYKRNEYVKPKYKAEKVGTEIDKPIGDGVVVQEMKQAKDGTVSISVVDSEGQFRTYKLFDGKGDSLLDDVTMTGEKSPYKVVQDPEDLTKAGTPRKRVMDTRSGELVAVFKPGEQIKTSQLEALSGKVLQTAERIKAGEATKREIVEMAKQVDEDTFKKAIDDAPDKNAGKELDC